MRLSGTKVSKKHCVLNVRPGSIRIDDLKSSNGVFVNGKRVTSATLKEKDRLVIGDFVLELGTSAEGPPIPRKPGVKA